MILLSHIGHRSHDTVTVIVTQLCVTEECQKF